MKLRDFRSFFLLSPILKWVLWIRGLTRRETDLSNLELIWTRLEIACERAEIMVWDEGLGRGFIITQKKVVSKRKEKNGKFILKDLIM